MGDQRDKDRISRVAQLIRSGLDGEDGAAQVKWRRRFSTSATNTQGWMVRLGSLGRGKPYLEVWLDRYAGRRKRYFWFGFYSPNPHAMRQLIRYQSDSLQPVRTLGDAD